VLERALDAAQEGGDGFVRVAHPKGDAGSSRASDEVARRPDEEVPLAAFGEGLSSRALDVNGHAETLRGNHEPRSSPPKRQGPLQARKEPSLDHRTRLAGSHPAEGDADGGDSFRDDVGAGGVVSVETPVPAAATADRASAASATFFI
jgi:hypothetical protein